jgi:hypothetical protein
VSINQKRKIVEANTKRGLIYFDDIKKEEVKEFIQLVVVDKKERDQGD